MGETLREYGSSPRFNTILSGIAAVAGIVTLIGGLALYRAADLTNSHDIQSLQLQVTLLANQVSGLADKIDRSPRSDQLHDIDRHLSALDGRMDGMDTRIGSDERALTQAQTRLDNIRDASDAQLRGHPR